MCMTQIFNLASCCSRSGTLTSSDCRSKDCVQIIWQETFRVFSVILADAHALCCYELPMHTSCSWETREKESREKEKTKKKKQNLSWRSGP